MSRKYIKIVATTGLLILGLLVPLLLFLNRVLEPDVSCDSLNYHLYLGFKGWNPVNNKYEFFPTGAHNFSPILEMVGFGFYKLLGYRLGTIFSLLAIYYSIFGLYKILKLILPKLTILSSLVGTFLFVSGFLSFELFLGLGSYFNDGLVAMLTVWSLYFLLKYFKNNKFFDLILASALMSVSVWGKQTNLYMAIAFGLVMVIDWLCQISRIKTRNLILSGVIVLSLPLFWYWGNWQATGNPIFPFYNAIFKSEFAAPQNLVEPGLGGQNLKEKILWGYYSMFETFRLGQVHDLFHDYKINFYFLFGGLLTIIYGLNKKIRDKLTSRLMTLYWLAFFVWSLQFGYLRYALALEFLGGLWVLIMYYKMGKFKYLLFIPACLWLVVQNKRVINMSLAYDISFRPGFFYNQKSYLKNWPNLFDSKITVKNKFTSDIYLNCAVTGMTYYTVSPFNNLPVLNIDQSAYKFLTDDGDYMAKQRQRMEPWLVGKKSIKFVTIAAKTGLNTEYNSCVTNLKIRGWTIDREEEADFVGYSNQKLGIIWGTISRDLFDKMGY